MVPEADYRIKLPVFEGPLDLLLFLIRKNELDIYDIPIESVTRQYIAALHAMQELDLEIAGDFFVMAATLMEIKSRLLLPKGQHAVATEDEDDAMDPRWELVHQLVQYKRFKEAGEQLDELITQRHDLIERSGPAQLAESGERPLKPLDRIQLWQAFNNVLRRLAETGLVGEIQEEQVTVSDRMDDLLLRLRTQKRFRFSEILPAKITLRYLVATFLAVLELTRLKRLRLAQDEAFADILCTAVEDDDRTPPPPSPDEEPSTDPLAGRSEMPLETHTQPTTVSA
ncbi:chromosome segregation protein ScpA [Cephaloticoccus primus]|uniref:Segregation and condensation protein A n=1 Tax=Cephaloticoccus primus TaxID=1548207 RepID=A0A139SMT7_9BACT|nr:segregation/condensation protein A [Cephaloticoccus primus]KXU35829.1 chromosome segregation protein ScpA [Cephaloticoccus primus]